MKTDILLSLTQDEAVSIVHVLGNLPTSSGAYPLMMKVKGMIDSQLAQQEPEPKPE